MLPQDVVLPSALQRWDDALLAARLLCIDPQGLGGAVLQASPGPARDRWLKALQHHRPAASPWKRLPLHAEESRLLGGLDLPATLRSGHPVMQNGLLADSDRGYLVCAMAERLPRRTLSHLTQALDHRQLRVERDGMGRVVPTSVCIIALDEAESPDETGCSEVLTDRLAFSISLAGVDWRSAGAEPFGADSPKTDPAGPAVTDDTDHAVLDQARRRLAQIELSVEQVSALCEASLALGITSTRAPWLAARAACALAAWGGRLTPESQDIADAARLVLGPRARHMPNLEASTPDPQEPTPPADAEPPPPADATASAEPESSPPSDPIPASDDFPDKREKPAADPPPEASGDLTVAAVQAALPAGLLALMARQNGLSRGAVPSSGQASSVAGERQSGSTQGRPVGVRQGQPGGGQRLSLVDTLRQAAPWQRLRSASAPASASAALGQNPRPRAIRVRPEDFRIIRRQPRRPTTTVFLVDASGSNALHRLAEAKGAVESLLVDCYVRRDRVAVLAFRGRQADLLLPPTRSLVRAKRSLGGLPGGGGTPLALALEESRQLCEALVRRGESVSLVILTDGKANIALDGQAGRERAHGDALLSAHRLSTVGLRTLLIDTSPKPTVQAREVAAALGGRYIPLPQARQGELSTVVRNSLLT